MQIEGVNRDAIEFLQATVAETPKALNALDVCCIADELILSMIDSVMLTVSDIDQPVITTPPITIDDDIGSDATANNRLQSALFAVRHNLGIDTTISLEDAADDRLARCATPALASDATSAKVRFIDFFFARAEGRSACPLFSNPGADFEKDRGYSFARARWSLQPFCSRSNHARSSARVDAFYVH